MVGGIEALCSTLVLLGLGARLTALPLLVIILVALATTKAQVMAEQGLWPLLHSSRTDWAMLLGSLFLLVRGGGRWSADNHLRRP